MIELSCNESTIHAKHKDRKVLVYNIPKNKAYLSSFCDLSFSISNTVYLLRLELKYILETSIHCEWIKLKKANLN